MTDEMRVIAAYLYLCAYEKQGAKVTSFDIHTAYIEFCRSTSPMTTYYALDLLGAAKQEGFLL